MSTEISWQVKLTVKPGELENFRVLTREMTTHAKTETGVLIYERFISEDASHVFVYERYRDSASALAHLKAFHQMFSERFSHMIKREHFIVFGIPDQELKKTLDKLGAVYAAPLLRSGVDDAQA